MTFQPTPCHKNVLWSITACFFILISCSKDNDLLSDAVLDTEVITTSQENTETSETEEEPETTEIIEEEAVDETTQKAIEDRKTVFKPINDAHIQNGKGYNQTIVRLEEDLRTTYLMFDLSQIDSIGGHIVDVSLEFTVEADNGSGVIAVHKGTSNDWSEENISSENAPNSNMKLGELVTEYKIGSKQEIALDTTNVRPEVFSLVMTHEKGNDLAFASKENPNGKAPELVVVYSAPQDAETIISEEDETELVVDTTEENQQGQIDSEETPQPETTEPENNPEVPTEEEGGGETTPPTEEDTIPSTPTPTQPATPTPTQPEQPNNQPNAAANEGPIAIADATPSSGSAPLKITFKGDNSTDDKGIKTFLWNFKDGSTSSEANPSHTFTKVGVYEVQLVVKDTEGETDTDTVTITVKDEENKAPVAIAKATPSTGEAPLEVQFNGKESTDDSAVTSYAWDFKDGSKASVASPSHTFDKPGTYVVQLKVKDENGLEDTETVTVKVTEPENKAPIAKVSGAPLSGNAPLNVQFKGSSSSDDKKVTGYSWDFKDGSKATSANPTHTFNAPGTYQVELTVSDEKGLSNKASLTVTVKAPSNKAPVAIASGTPLTGEAPLNVQFNGSKSNDDNGVTGYFWDFQDGSSSTSTNPSHSFTDPGNYAVTLTVKDAQGLTHSNSVTIKVTSPSNNNGPISGAYYVTTNGRASNNGKTEASAWSIEHAFKQAAPGDVIYIKAGNYGNKQLVNYQSGNSSRPIKFIGYTNTPGDLVSGSSSTFSHGQSLNANKMPLFKGSSSKSGFGLDFNGNYIELHNVQITNYLVGLYSKGTGALFKNVIISDNGEQNSNSVQGGRAFQIYGNNTTIENSFVLNSNGEGINIKGASGCTIRNTSVYSDNRKNPTGYYILLSSGARNTLVENCTVYRDRNADLHRGHGLVLKDQATNNTIRNCTTYNTGIEVNFSGVSSNTFENIDINGSYSSDNGEYSSSIRVLNGAHDNTFKNISLDNTHFAVVFTDLNDGYVGPGGDRDKKEGGHNNKFISIRSNNTGNIVAATSAVVGASAFSNNNTFSNCTFNDVSGTPFYSYQDMNNTKFINCNFTNMPSKVMTKEFKGGTFPISFQNCSFSNVGFPKP